MHRVHEQVKNISRKNAMKVASLSEVTEKPNCLSGPTLAPTTAHKRCFVCSSTYIKISKDNIKK